MLLAKLLNLNSLLAFCGVSDGVALGHEAHGDKRRCVSSRTKAGPSATRMRAFIGSIA